MNYFNNSGKMILTNLDYIQGITNKNAYMKKKLRNDCFNK